VIHGVLTTAKLIETTGYQRAADIERCLREQGVRYFWGKDGPWTTMDLVNAAGGLKASSNDGMYEGSIL
jgi:hypothetical protein